MDQGKHAGRAAAAWPSSSCRWLWSSLSPLGGSGIVQHPRVLSPGCHQTLQNHPTASFEHSKLFSSQGKGAKVTLQEQERNLECEFGVSLRKPTPAERSALVTTGQKQPWIPAGSHCSVVSQQRPCHYLEIMSEALNTCGQKHEAARVSLSICNHGLEAMLQDPALKGKAQPRQDFLS